MPKSIDTQLHMKRHSEMIKFQNNIKPFSPTIRELKRLWKLNTTSSAFLTVKRLEVLGLIVSRKKGTHTQYYAIQVKG